MTGQFDHESKWVCERCGEDKLDDEQSHEIRDWQYGHERWLTVCQSCYESYCEAGESAAGGDR